MKKLSKFNEAYAAAFDVADCIPSYSESIALLCSPKSETVTEDLAAETWIKSAGVESLVRRGINTLVKIYKKATGKEKSPEELAKIAVEKYKRISDENLRIDTENREYLEKIEKEWKDKAPSEESKIKTAEAIEKFLEKMPLPVTDTKSIAILKKEIQDKIRSDTNLRDRILGIMKVKNALLADKLAAIYLMLFGAIYFDWEKHAVTEPIKGTNVNKVGVKVGDEPEIKIPYDSWKTIAGKA